MIISQSKHLKFPKLSTISLLFSNINWYVVPLLIFKKRVLIKMRNNLQFYVTNLMDIWVLKEVIIDKKYNEYKEIGDNDYVIDVGAGIGDFSILASKKSRYVYSFEINKERIELMKQNIKINNCKNIKLFSHRVISLDEIFSISHIKRCDFLKIDCEGCEYDLFSAVSQSLSKIKYIAMEVHLYNDILKKKNILLIKILKKEFNIKIFNNIYYPDLKFIYATKKV